MTGAQNHIDWRRFGVVLVDFQHDFWTDEVAATAPELPDRVAALLEYARSHGLTVVHVRAQFDATGSDWMARYRLRGRIPCIVGTPGVDTLPFACEVPGEPVVIKHSFDGFLQTGLHDLLVERGIEGLLICGLVTSTCVLFTAATATQLGYFVSVLDDCCADHDDAHRTTLARYQFMFDVVPSLDLPRSRDRWEAQLDAMRPDDRS